jgi:hypothetical protein
LIFSIRLASLLTAASGLFLISLPVLALQPSDRTSLLLKASGSMWGATEDTFGVHCFSLKSDRGVAIWTDSRPGLITLVNPENKTYLTESMDEYLDDNNYGVHFPPAFQSGSSRAVKQSDGSELLEVTYLRRSRASGGKPREAAQISYRHDVKLSPLMLRAWSTIMLASPEQGFPVNLRVRSRHHHQEDQSESFDPAKPWRELVAYHSLKVVPFDPVRFTVPRDYKRAQDKSAFYFSSNGVLKKSDIDDLFRSEVK